MTCSFSSRISHAPGRQPQSRARRQRDRRPATHPKVQCRYIRTLVPVNPPLATTRASIQNA